MIKLELLEIPLTIITKNTTMLLISISPWVEYKDGKKTDTQIGHRYEVVETSTFEKFVVKVKDTTPVLSTEQLTNAKEHITVTFDNAICKPYRTGNGNYDLSITAKSISIVK